MIGSELVPLMPMFLVGAGVAVYLLARAAPPADRARVGGGWSAAFLAAAFGILLFADARGERLDLGLLVLANSSHLGTLLGLLATGIGFFASIFSMDRIGSKRPAHLYFPLMMFAVAGVVAVGAARDLFTLFVMVELSAVPSYALVAWNHREDPRALPAAVKYLLQGAAGTVTALLGSALFYVEGGTLSLDALPRALAGADPLFLALGAGLILVGYGVKLAVVPLHTWLPDAYCHAPAPVTAVMAGVTKAGVLVALFLCFSALPAGSGAGAPATVLGTVVCALAVLTMTAGNLLALGQKDIRRVLAYSSVAQMGYVLLGFGVGLRWGVVSAFEAGLFYAVAYSVMKAGAFLGADLLAVSAGSSEISGLRGAGGRHPLLGLSFAVFVLGLVGLPATAGFPGKLLLVRAGFGTGEAAGAALSLLLVLNSALSLGYYGPLLTGVLFRRREDPAPAEGPAPPPAAMASVACLALATVLLGLFPSALGDWIQIASRTLFPGGAP